MTKKLEDYEWICPEPFVGVYTTTTGQFRPCCTMPKYLNPEQTEKYNVDTSTHKEFYNSEFMHSLRTALKNNDRSFLDNYCNICKTVEDSGGVSSRKYYVNKFNELFYDKKEELELIIENNLEPSFHSTVQLDSLGGNYCNLSCSMCGERASSSLLKEKLELKEEVYAPITFVNSKQRYLIKPKNSPDFLEEIPSFVNNCKEIKFVGGEPLLCKEIYDLMNICEKKSETIVRITTNGTINPEKFISFAKAFKKVVVNISIEGYGKVNDYIRYPSNWDDILLNYDKFCEAGFVVSFVTTINALNISRLYQIPLNLPNVKYGFNSFVGNNFYSINSIPEELKTQYILLLSKKRNFLGVDNLILYLNNSKFNENEMIGMLKHIKRRDVFRGTNLLSVFPEWRPYYNNV